MTEPDDRLAGDLVWELFPSTPTRTPLTRRLLPSAGVVALFAVSWALYPPAAVAVACLAASIRDIRSGWQMSKAIPDKAGGRICALFAYAWGAWKLGATGFAMIILSGFLDAMWRGGTKDFLQPALLALLIWMGGFLMAAILTAAGLVMAYRSKMRVWVGEGINQARTLLLGMLIVGFACTVLFPLSFLLAVQKPPAPDGTKVFVTSLMGFILLLFVAPVILLIVLDHFTKEIVALSPGKFGPKVPTVGKWK